MLRRPSVPRSAGLHGVRNLGLLLISACGGEDTIEDDFAADAPIVIETTPKDGERDVDASLDAITATFSEAMDRGGWSWVTEVGRSAPSLTGLPFYLDEQTTVLPVRLDPATHYVIWINSPDDAELRKFANPDGVSARAHRIRFETRPAE